MHNATTWSVLTSIILNTVIVVTFISIFFFTYVFKVERKIVSSQVNSLMDDLNREMDIVLDADKKNELKQFMAQLPVDTSNDARVEQDNQALRAKAFKMLAYIVGIGAVLVIAGVLIFKLEVKPLLLSAFITLASVALTEFIFLTCFAYNYKTLDDNKVKLALVRALKQYSG